ncbi:MAG: hypothetical protein ACYCOU_03505 [Sulfobacillus sp.]
MFFHRLCHPQDGQRHFGNTSARQLADQHPIEFVGANRPPHLTDELRTGHEILMPELKMPDGVGLLSFLSSLIGPDTMSRLDFPRGPEIPFEAMPSSVLVFANGVSTHGTKAPGPYYLILGPDGRAARVPVAIYLRLSRFIGNTARIDPSAYQRIVSALRVVSRTGTAARFYHFPWVSGVINYYLMADSPKFPDKCFVMFGDLHADNRGQLCPSPAPYFPEMLSQVIANTEDYVDMFFEFAYHRPGEDIEGWRLTGSHETIHDTRAFFWDCLQSDKSACRRKYPNLRLHYADYRESSSPLIKAVTGAANILRALADIPEKIETPARFPLENLFAQLPQGISAWKAWYRQVVRESKLNKELAAIPDPETAQKIVAFGEQVLLAAYAPPSEEPLIDDIRWALRSGSAAEAGLTAKMLLGAYAWLVGMLTPVMEVYLLSRAFRQYRDPGSEARNILVYAGGVHVKNYVEFLRLMEFRVIEHASHDAGYSSPSRNPNPSRNFCLNAPAHQPYFVLPFQR